MKPEEIRPRVEPKVQVVEKYFSVGDVCERSVNTDCQTVVRLVKAESRCQHLGDSLPGLPNKADQFDDELGCINARALFLFSSDISRRKEEAKKKGARCLCPKLATIQKCRLNNCNKIQRPTCFDSGKLHRISSEEKNIS